MKNQKQQVLWYLINWDKFSMLDLIKDSAFYKFPARLSEIEKEYGTIAKREKQSFTNRFGRKSSYCIYSAIDKRLISRLINNY